jgi:hypothetical protein
VTLRKVTIASQQPAQISNSDTQPVDIVLVGRPGLEVGEFAGLSGISGNELEFAEPKCAANSRRRKGRDARHDARHEGGADLVLPRLPSALAAVAEAWVRLPAGAVARLSKLGQLT